MLHYGRYCFYAGMDWLCPGFNEVLGKQLTALHGNITANNTIREVVPIVQTGDLHIAVYDLPNEILYTANAKADDETGPPMAYDRQGCIPIHKHTHTILLLLNKMPLVLNVHQ